MSEVKARAKRETGDRAYIMFVQLCTGHWSQSFRDMVSGLSWGWCHRHSNQTRCLNSLSPSPETWENCCSWEWVRRQSGAYTSTYQTIKKDNQHLVRKFHISWPTAILFPNVVYPPRALIQSPSLGEGRGWLWRKSRTTGRDCLISKYWSFH